MSPTNRKKVGDMAAIAQLDTKRRLVLPKEFVDEYGTKFVLLRLPGEILLKPLPKNPFAALKQEGRKLKGITAEQFEKAVAAYVKERV